MDKNNKVPLYLQLVDDLIKKSRTTPIKKMKNCHQSANYVRCMG